MMNKKGQVFVLMVTVFVIIALTSIYIALSHKYEGKSAESIRRDLGDYQSAMIDAFQEKERVLFYIDQSARLSSFDSLEELGDKGGLENSACNAYIYNLWNEEDKECYPQDYETLLKSGINKSLILFLNHSDSPIKTSYSYEVRQEENLKIYGLAEDDKEILVSKGKIIVQNNNVIMTELSEDIVERIESYDDLIKKYSLKNAVPVPLIKSLIYHESAGNKNARSQADALGLMQIVPFSLDGTMINHKFCVETGCGFSDADNAGELRKQEYFDEEKNICCGASFLKELMSKKSNGRWDCQGVKADYENEFEIALRYYNGWSCTNLVDPDYVETVGRIYELYTDTPLSPSIFGTYTFKPDFTAIINYNISIYDELVEFSKELVDECDEDVRNCMNGKLEDFNLNNNVQIKRDCEENPVYYDLIEGYEDCSNSNEYDCICNLELDISKQTEDIHIRFKDKNITLEEPVSAHNDYLLGFEPAAISEKPSNTRQKKDYIDYYVKLDNGNAEDYVGIETGLFDTFGSFFTLGSDKKWDDLIIYKDSNGILTFVKEKDDKPTCNRAKEKYRLCAETPFTLFGLENDKRIIKPSNIKFSLRLPDKLPPVIQGFTAADDLMQDDSIVIGWNNILRSVHDLDYYLVYCSETSFNSDVEKEAHSLIVIPENEQDISMRITECNGEPIRDNVQYYFAVTAIDRTGNEQKQVIEASATAVENELLQTDSYTNINRFITILISGQDYGLFYSDSTEILYPETYEDFIDDKLSDRRTNYINIYDSEEGTEFHSFYLNEQRGERIKRIARDLDDDAQIDICNKGQTDQFSQDSAILNRRFEFVNQKDDDCIEEVPVQTNNIHFTVPEDKTVWLKWTEPDVQNIDVFTVYYSENIFEYTNDATDKKTFLIEEVQLRPLMEETFEIDYESVELDTLYYDYDDEIKTYFTVLGDLEGTGLNFSVVATDNRNYRFDDIQLSNWRPE